MPEEASPASFAAPVGKGFALRELELRLVGFVWLGLSRPSTFLAPQK